ncbi:RsmB/NOP family class I SAM-dependent RNA methyltransferase [Aestuariivirga sp.]|uniref:RsmB/NOP family class I SAM-dependent RNA methyltransferase n=1 Tax=Aestuariivirga sp. TaxID=2650926 RepID=UPI003BAD4970
MEQQIVSCGRALGLKPSAPEAHGLEVRLLATTLLRMCLERRLPVEDAVSGSDKASSLPPRDRALLSTLLLTSFRHRGEVEAILAKLLDKPLPRKSGSARDILVLGVTQLLFLDMPPHAVIDLAVRSAKADRNALHFSGLVNAVLRKAALMGPEFRMSLDAVRLNTPDWLWNRWTRAYGEDTTRSIALANADRPGLDLSFKDDSASWLELLEGVCLPNGQLRLPVAHVPVPELAGFAEGAWWVQDVASSIPARLFGDLNGKRILDLCAAPGGKTLQLASLGAEVTAVDISEQRLRRLTQNLARTGLAAEIRTLDMFDPGLEDCGWDGVLLDAPCSATGTIRRHPELPYLKDESQVLELAGQQRRMLRRAAELVKPGGMLVYCSCSLEPEEGESQIRSFLRRDERFEIVPAAGSVGPEESLTAEGWIRTLPSMRFGSAQGMDGFFAAGLRRQV